MQRGAQSEGNMLPKRGRTALGGINIFSAYYLHSEGWTSSNEALMGAVAEWVAGSSEKWLVGCEANVSSSDMASRTNVNGDFAELLH